MILDPLSPEIIKPIIEAPTLRNPFDEFNIPTLLPTVPAQAAVTNTDVNSDGSNPDYYAMINKSLDTNRGEAGAPLYEMKSSQLERYDNPYLPYTAAPQGFKSIEGAYGANQGWFEQFLNGVIKTGPTIAGTFIGNFTAMPNQIDSFRKGDVAGALFAEDSSFNGVARWMQSFENQFPNYLTDLEQDRPWYVNAFTPTGAANFWGDTIIKNSGFMIGSMLSAAAVDAALTVATEGAAAPIALIDFGRRIGSMIPKMKNMYRSLSKVSALGKSDDVIGMMNTGETLLEATRAAKAASTMSQLGKAGHFVATTYFSTQGEAMIEGYHTYVDTKTKLLEEALQSGEELSPERLAAIEDTAAGAGQMTAIFNSLILAPSNMIQFPKLMGWKKMTNLTKKIDTPYIKYDIGEKGIEAVNTYTRKAGIRNVLKDAGLKSFLPESLEEGGQYFVGNSIHDYYIDKFNNKTKDSLGNYMINALPETLGDKDFWKEFFIGGISGTTVGGVMPGSQVKESVKNNLIGARAKVNGYVSSINDNLDKFNAASAQLTSFGELLNFDAAPSTGATPNARATFINKHESAYKAFHRVVSDAATYGQLENLRDSINDLKELPLSEFNKLAFVGIDMPTGEKGVKTELEKQEKLDQMLIEIDRVQDDLDAVEESFKANPFDNAAFKKKYKDAGFKDEDINALSYNLFQDFKKNQVYTIGRLRNIQDTQNTFFNELKFGANLDPDSIDSLKAVLLNIRDKDSISTYLEYKQRMLESLETQRELYATKAIKNPHNVTKLNRAINSLVSTIEKLEEYGERDKLTELEVAELTELLFNEEFGESQAELAFMSNMQDLESLKRTAEEELKRASKNPNAAASDIEKAIEEIERQKEEERKAAEEAAKTPEQKEAEKQQREKEDKEREEKVKADLEEQRKKQAEEAEKEVIVPPSTIKATKEEDTKKGEEEKEQKILENLLKERMAGMPTLKQSEAVENQFYFKKDTKVMKSSSGQHYVMVFAFTGEQNSNGLNKYKAFKIFVDDNGNISYEDMKSMQAFSYDIVPVRPSQKAEPTEPAAQQPTSKDVLEAKKADIERRRQEELFGNLTDLEFETVDNKGRIRKTTIKTKVDENGFKYSIETTVDGGSTSTTFPKTTKQEIKKSAIYENLDQDSKDFIDEIPEDAVIMLQSIAISTKTNSAAGLGNGNITIGYASKSEGVRVDNIALKYQPNKINAKYDAELAALESKPAKVKDIVEGTQESEEFETKTFPKYPAEPVATYDLKTEEGRNKLIEDIRKRSKKVILEKKHYSVLNRIYQRVTSVFTDKEFEPSPILNSGSYIGTKLDEIVRKIFATDALATYEEYRADFEEMYTGGEKELRTFIDKMNGLKTKMKERGETVLSDDIKLYSNKYGYAGTVDLISIDTEGKVRIYDLKSFRKNPDNDTYDKDTIFGESYRKKHTKQLSLYSQAFLEMYGIEVSELEVIPVKVQYEGGDVKTSELVLWDNKIIEKNTDIEGIITASSKRAIGLTENITEFLGDKPDLYDFFIRAVKADLFTINCN